MESVRYKLKTLIVKSIHWRHHFTEEELLWMQTAAPFVNIKTCLFSEIRHAILNNIKTKPVCPVCGKEVVYNPAKKVYRAFCSKTCEKSPEGIQARLKKASDTSMEKYGVPHAVAAKQTREKIEQTFLEHYGTTKIMQVGSVKENHKKTILEKYGVENISSSEVVQENRKKTLVKRYGVDHMSKIEGVTEKKKQVFMEKYGVENISQSEEIRLKKLTDQRDEYWPIFCELLEQKNIIPLFTKEEYISYDFTKGYKKFLCKKCNTEFQTEALKVQKIYCASHIYDSQGELELFNYIVNDLHYSGVVQRNKKLWYDGKNYELDIYIPEFNLGIEHHGLYWHSEACLDPSYHFNKYEFFKIQGIRLLQIFEHEWLENTDIVKALIRSAIGIKPSKIVYARQTTIKSISGTEFSSFCEMNHLQGSAPASTRYGMFCGELLVAVLGIGKPRYNKKYDFEIVRYCIGKDIIVVGAFNKLLKHFRNIHHGSIITYADLRYFTGNSYRNAGFAFTHVSKPSYFYFNKIELTQLIRRTSAQKHKLNTILPNFDETKTEHENMLANKYLRVYDAGTAVFVLP